MMQSALNVDKNVKFHSNPIKADLYTAENVMLKKDPPEEIDIKLTNQHLFMGSFYIRFFLSILSHVYAELEECIT
jgi:hypothetical protein